MTRSMPFYLLRPQELPGTSRDTGAVGVGGAATAALTQRILTGADEGTLELALGELREHALGTADFTVVTDDREESAGNRANDRAFGIVRVTGDVPRILRHSMLRGYTTLLEEEFTSGTELPPDALGRLHLAFWQLFQLVSDDRSPAGPVDSIEVASRPRPAVTGGNALRRWTRGHHIFMMLVQGLVISVNRLRDELRRQDIPQARHTLSAAATIMWGSAAALQFTGDFPYSEYEKQVRPTLLPPIAPPDMTGLRWRDHEYLIKVLAGSRTAFMDLDPRLETQRRQFLDALSQTYEAHRNVCAHFVGVDQPSVLMATRSATSAVDTLERFKRSRSQLVRGVQRPADES